MKICKGCLKEKSLDSFYKRKDSLDGYRQECKECIKKKRRKYYDNNIKSISERKKKYYEVNKGKALKQMKKYREENKDYFEQYRKNYYKENKERIKLKRRIYYNENKNKIKIKDTRYYKENRENILYKKRLYEIANPEKILLRNSRRKALRRLGTPIWYEYQREEIQAIYKEARELTIKTGILHHVDHIYPLKPRKKTDPVGLHVVANLQILTAEENVRKSNLQPEEWEKRRYVS